MERLLIIGSSGLLGSRMAELARGRFEVFGTYGSHPSGLEREQRLDAREREKAFSLIEKAKPSFVVDTHSLTNLDYCETHHEEAWGVNVEGAKNIAEACKRFGSKYVFISTDNVFDGKKLRYIEKDMPHPLNYYARTKLVMEHALSALDVNYLVVRTAVLYGTGGSGKVSFPTWLASKLRKGEEVRIVTDQKNNPTLTDSLAEFIFRLCQKDETGVFHVAGSECLSRYEFSVRIAKALSLDKSLIRQVTSPELNQIAPRPSMVNIASDKAERATGLKAIGVDEGLAIFRRQLVIK